MSLAKAVAGLESELLAVPLPGKGRSELKHVSFPMFCTLLVLTIQLGKVEVGEMIEDHPQDPRADIAQCHHVS